MGGLRGLVRITVALLSATKCRGVLSNEQEHEVEILYVEILLIVPNSVVGSVVWDATHLLEARSGSSVSEKLKRSLARSSLLGSSSEARNSVGCTCWGR